MLAGFELLAPELEIEFFLEGSRRLVRIPFSSCSSRHSTSVPDTPCETLAPHETE